MKKIVVVLLISILGVCLLVGCAKDEKAHSIEYKVACSTIPIDVYLQNPYSGEILKKVDSVQGYEKLCNDNDILIFDENNENYDSDLCKDLRSYDDSYFEENSLIVLTYYSKEIYDEKINNIKLNGEVLEVDIDKKFSEEHDSINSNILVSYAFFIEVKKSEVKNVDDINLYYLKYNEGFSNEPLRERKYPHAIRYNE